MPGGGSYEIVRGRNAQDEEDADSSGKRKAGSIYLL